VYLQNGLAALLGAVVNVANGGLVVFGALLGGVMGLVAFRLKYRVPLLATADLMAPSLILGQAIGRIGCLLNGCCFGGPCELPWAVTFPWNSPAQVYQVMHGQLDLYGMKLADGRGGLPAVAEVQPGSAAERAGLKPGEQIRAINHMPVDSAKEACWALLQSPRGEPSLLVERAGGLPSLQLPVPQPLPRSLPVHPTQLYSLIEGLLLCLLLLVYDRFRRRDGELLAVLLTLHPIGRFLVEAIRTDEPAIWGTGMHLSQNLSLLILAVAVGLWIYVLRRPPGLAYNGV
jgi:phosphatidylglycerol:prolipoprotein diacylglycerol transferase